MSKAKIKSGALVQIVETVSRKPMNPPVYGLVIDWAYSKLGTDYWHCAWANGMSSEVHAASCELEVVCEAHNE